MSYLTSVKTINGETSGFYEYPIKYVATSAEATDNDTLYVLTGNSLGDIVPSLYFKHIDPYNPLGLPPYTIRIQVKPGTHLVQATPKGTITAVPGETDVYDVCTAGLSNPGDWSDLLFGGETYNQWGDPEGVDSNVIAILGANSTGVTNMYNMCCYCKSLKDVALFDTSTVTHAHNMFAMAFDDYNTFGSELTHIPNFNFASLTRAEGMFFWCTKVESGALTLYNQLNALGGQITDHTQTFHNCGSDTVTGAAELAQIPSNWK